MIEGEHSNTCMVDQGPWDHLRIVVSCPIDGGEDKSHSCNCLFMSQFMTMGSKISLTEMEEDVWGLGMNN